DIIYQKYILFVYENVFEAYADYRRTGFPVLLTYEGQPIPNAPFPKRLRYPYSEYGGAAPRPRYTSNIIVVGQIMGDE
ncbi:MAG: hypothetical protein CSB02_01130, partial [Bacteroidia bacterium]